MEIEQAQLCDWEDVREVRLRGLRTDPDAFGAAHAQEAVAPPERWRAWITGDARRLAACFLGRDAASTPVAIATTTLDAGHHTAHLYGMWVDPRARRHGLGAALVDAVGTWARERGAIALELSVADGNPAALALYTRLGFVVTGGRHLLGEGRDDRGIMCSALRRDL